MLNSLLSTFRSTFNNLINKVCALESQTALPSSCIKSHRDVYGNDSAVEMRLPLCAMQTRNKLRALRDERSARRSPESTRRHPACHCGKSEASSGNREKPLRLINQEITRNAGLRCFFVSSLIGLVLLAA